MGNTIQILFLETLPTIIQVGVFDRFHKSNQDKFSQEKLNKYRRGSKKLLESILIDEDNSCYVSDSPSSGVISPSDIYSGCTTPNESKHSSIYLSNVDSFLDMRYLENHLFTPRENDDSDDDEHEIFELKEKFRAALVIIRNNNREKTEGKSSESKYSVYNNQSNRNNNSRNRNCNCNRIDASPCSVTNHCSSDHNIEQV